MRISQNGNTANNGFHNFLILGNNDAVDLIGRPSVAGIRHAFSQPIWDISPYIRLFSASTPNWTKEETLINELFTSTHTYPRSIRQSAENSSTINQYQSMLEKHLLCTTYQVPVSVPVSEVASPTPAKPTSSALFSATRRLIQQGRFWSEKAQTNAAERVFNAQDVDVHLTFGSATPHISTRVQRKVCSVVIEHGQMRWIMDGPSSLHQQRRDFYRLCQNAQHIWLTNVDTRSVSIAKELFPNKWSILPHPYVLDESTPYPEVPGTRNHLCSLVNSDFLIFSPSSISIGGDQQKGTDKLLTALAAIRHENGIRVGAYFVNWGQDVPKAIALIRRLKIEDQCRFIEPLTRVGLQRYMCNFDIVSDQFDYDAFGSLTIRTLEQGMPLLSKPINNEAAELMGGKPPVMPASSAKEIQDQILQAVSMHRTLGREKYLDHHREHSRNWLLGRHHHSFTETLQVERYQEMLQPKFKPSQPGRWGEIPNWFSNP
jgi:hypothetical protein